jgi:hypothetical protein
MGVPLISVDPDARVQAGSKWILDHLRWRASRMTALLQAGAPALRKQLVNGFWITCAGARPE